jgi:hypothetical protein
MRERKRGRASIVRVTGKSASMQTGDRISSVVSMGLPVIVLLFAPRARKDLSYVSDRIA